MDADQLILSRNVARSQRLCDLLRLNDFNLDLVEKEDKVRVMPSIAHPRTSCEEGP